MRSISADIFEGPHFGIIFGTLMVAAIAGGTTGLWRTGITYDVMGSYPPAFSIIVAVSALSTLAIWRAAPRTIFLVPGRARR